MFGWAFSFTPCLYYQIIHIIFSSFWHWARHHTEPNEWVGSFLLRVSSLTLSFMRAQCLPRLPGNGWLLLRFDQQRTAKPTPSQIYFAHLSPSLGLNIVKKWGRPCFLNNLLFNWVKTSEEHTSVSRTVNRSIAVVGGIKVGKEPCSGGRSCVWILTMGPRFSV